MGKTSRKNKRENNSIPISAEALFYSVDHPAICDNSDVEDRALASLLA